MSPVRLRPFAAAIAGFGLLGAPCADAQGGQGSHQMGLKKRGDTELAVLIATHLVRSQPAKMAAPGFPLLFDHRFLAESAAADHTTSSLTSGLKKPT